MSDSSETISEGDIVATPDDDTPARGRGKRKPAKPSRPPWQSALRWVGEFAAYVLIAVLVVTLVRLFLVQPFLVPSESMEQTLTQNDTILVWKPGAPVRGEIVVFRDDLGWLPPQAGATPWWKNALAAVKILPPQNEQYLVKRLIGLPGDHVVCCDDKNRIVVNGQPLEESSYLYYSNPAIAMMAFDIVVPKGRFFVMGDHRDRSADSRMHWCNGPEQTPQLAFPSLDAIQGRTFAIMRPFSRATTFSIPDTFSTIPPPTAEAPDPTTKQMSCPTLG